MAVLSEFNFGIAGFNASIPFKPDAPSDDMNYQPVRLWVDLQAYRGSDHGSRDDCTILHLIDVILEETKELPTEDDSFNEVMVRMYSQEQPTSDFMTCVAQAESARRQSDCFSWLPVIPKTVFTKTTDKVLSQIYLDTILAYTYTALEACGMGLDLLATSREDGEVHVLQRLQTLQTMDLQILDKLRSSMLKLNREVPASVKMSIVPAEALRLEGQERNLRDFLCYYSFLNCAQLLVDGLLDVRDRVLARQYKDVELYTGGEDTEVASWKNPGGFVDGVPRVGRSVPPRHRQIGDLVRLAEAAYVDASCFHGEYSWHYYNRSSSSLIEVARTFFFDWMPCIPKELHEDTPEAALALMDYEEFLLCCYHALQMCSMSLEMGRRDQVHMCERFADLFLHAEIKNRSVLHEMQMAMHECGLQADGCDVQRVAAPLGHRRQDVIGANKFRGFLVLRDYLNTLEFLVDGLHRVRDLELLDEEAAVPEPAPAVAETHSTSSPATCPPTPQ